MSVDSSLSFIPSSAFPKVIVVGAGIAGITVTKELRKKGWPRDKVILLEARADVGGRIRTYKHKSGFVYDAGAAYVHGTTGNPVAAIAEKAGIRLRQVSSGNPWLEGTPEVALVTRGERATEDELQETERTFREMMRRVSARANECDDANVSVSDTMAEILQEEPFGSLSTLEVSRLRLRLAAMALWHGGDLDDLQLLEFGTSTDGSSVGLERCGDYPGPHCVVDGGMRRIIDAMATEEVRECLCLESRVDAVSILDAERPFPPADEGSRSVSLGQRKETQGVLVSVKTGGISGTEESKVLHADVAVVTVPLSILQAGSIAFDPPMSKESTAAISRLRMGSYEKIIMEFPEPFWPADASFIGCCPLHSGDPVQGGMPDASFQSSNGACRPAKPDLVQVGSGGARSDHRAAVRPSVPPIFAENYLSFKGVPVLAVAVSGTRARQMARRAEAAAQAACAEGGDEDAGEEWRKACATELYHELVRPALRETFGNIPEPVSITTTGWAQQPYNRGSYSFFPLGAKDDDIYTGGVGAMMEASGGQGDPGSATARIVFAGEATSVEYEGSMHGGHLSGVRAVGDIMHSFGLPPRRE